MEREQLKKSNIDNLTNFWKLMGADKYKLNETNTIYASINWPNRVWLDWNYYPKSEDIEVLLSKIKQDWQSIVLSTWHEMDSDVISTLDENGFEVLFKQTAMVLPLNNKFEYTPNSLDFKEVTTREDAIIWTDIASQSFGYYIPAPLIQKIIGLPKLKLTLVCLSNTPVATGLLFEDSGVVGIHMVGVLPAYRRRGIARNLLDYLIDAAQQTDVAYATLQASIMGEPLYKELGFEKQFTITHFSHSKK